MPRTLRHHRRARLRLLLESNKLRGCRRVKLDQQYTRIGLREEVLNNLGFRWLRNGKGWDVAHSVQRVR